MDLRGALWAVVIACTAFAGATGCGTAGTPPQPTRPADAVARLVDLAIARLPTADTVAAVKWGTGGAIADPAREKVVLDKASSGAAQRGLDPRDVATVFQDQIAANKAVQYGLFADWSAEPGHAPARGPDVGEVRQELDRITGELLDELAAAHTTRESADCTASLSRAVDDAELDQHLDGLHRHGLERALRSVCR